MPGNDPTELLVLAICETIRVIDRLCQEIEYFKSSTLFVISYTR
jgi:hypothetical protein